MYLRKKYGVLDYRNLQFETNVLKPATIKEMLLITPIEKHLIQESLNKNI